MGRYTLTKGIYDIPFVMGRKAIELGTLEVQIGRGWHVKRCLFAAFEKTGVSQAPSTEAPVVVAYTKLPKVLN